MAYGIRKGIHFRIMEKQDLEKIHWATLYILEKVGVRVNSTRCRRLLTENEYSDCHRT